MDKEKRSGKIWRTLLILFAVVMVLLTLLSGTLQNAMLPKVITGKPSADKLKVNIKGDGRLQAAMQTDVNNPNGLPMKSILVKEGDDVDKGDTLVEFDMTDLNRQKLDEEAVIKQKELNAGKLKQDFINATIEGDEIQIQDATRSLDSYQIELGVEKRKLQALEEEIEKKRTLKAPFAGLISEVKANKEDLPSTGQEIMTLIKKADGYQFTFTIAEDQAKWLEEKETVDVQVTEGKQSARVKGTIESIAIGSGGGSSQGSGAGMGLSNKPNTDDQASAHGAAYQITIRITEDPTNMKLTTGMKASTEIIRVNDQKGYVIPNEWIKQDQDGKYVFLVEEQLGAFGNDYTVKKAYINVIASSEDQSLVSGLTQKDEIITETSEPIQKGDRVRVKS